MKFIPIILFSLFLTFSSFAQSSEEVLATANNQTFTIRDLPPEIQQAFEKLPATIAEMRKALLNQQIADVLLETEAAERKTTVEKLFETQVKNKVSAPTEKEIRAIYEANRAAVGDKTLEEIRPQIVLYLKREAEQKALFDYVAALKTKYKAAIGKDVNAPNLKSFDTLATIGGKAISAESFEAKNKQSIYDIKAEVYDKARDALKEVVLSSLIAAEAKAQNVAANDLIAREITDKMRDYTDEEREKLQSDLQKRLFQKYNAKILLKEPAPIVQNISIENQPAQGKRNAPVTVVMFTDFQCPACSATDPVLKKVLAEYADKIRFVVRDFPLVQIHENAFRAALAANAANAQGKFFEYIELLYKNQNSLDAESLKKYAAQTGLNQNAFDLDLESEKYADDVRKDIADGKLYGITGTPTIFVNGVKVRTLSADGFRQAIERALQR